MKYSVLVPLCAALAAASCNSQPVNRQSSEPLKTVSYVDLDRYAGRWYEIARFPNSFEQDCEGVTADYARRDDGMIRVVNTCREGSANGEVRTSEGRARIADETTNAKLEVSFFGPFWGDYWILYLTDDYSISLVGEPQGKYLWILSRTPTISADVRDDALARLAAMGYNVSALYFPEQPPVPDNPQPE